MKTEPLRVFLLEPGDTFIMNSTTYMVHRIEEGVIYFGTLTNEGQYISGTKNTMSAESQQRIELIVTNKLKICQQSQSNQQKQNDQPDPLNQFEPVL